MIPEQIPGAQNPMGLSQTLCPTRSGLWEKQREGILRVLQQDTSM